MDSVGQDLSSRVNFCQHRVEIWPRPRELGPDDLQAVYLISHEVLWGMSIAK
jgi:hypothetical protein